MSEPAIAPLATSAAVVTATVWMPGIDSDALVGAIAGAALFVTSSRELPLFRRVVYLLISAVIGYLAAPDVLAHLPLHSSAVAAFLAGALVVSVTVQLIERAKTFDVSTLFSKGE